MIEIKPVDRSFYQDRLAGFLPPKVIDIHTHVWPAQHAQGDTTGRTASWPMRVAAVCPVEDLLEMYRLMFPDKQVTPLIFGNPLVQGAIDEMNAYVAAAAAAHSLPALLLTRPEWTAEVVEEKIACGRFLGAKVYLSYAPASIAPGQIRIFDFLPHHQLELFDRHGWIVMLHIPRVDRLRDPLNLADLIEIERRYPRVRLIVAHVGRAYCPEDVGNAFDVLSDTQHMCFDISANTNAEVFERLLAAVGPRRVLFGSDMPITRMRMRRICQDGRYVNIIPRGLYGDVSADKHMREADGDEAARLTLFLYEEINAFRRAAEAQGLSAGDVRDVFYNNARRMIAAAGEDSQ
ncbi:MAG: amidohydrolase family protein [Planctomycetaceae bacterium]|nr:amidohydrolase [Planctomycetaceae bacterium]